MNAFVCVELNNLNFVRQNQQLLRVELYRNLMNQLSQDYELNDIDQKMTILSSSHIEFSRYMKIKKQDALALIRKFNKFIFFIILSAIHIDRSSSEIFFQTLISSIVST